MPAPRAQRRRDERTSIEAANGAGSTSAVAAEDGEEPAAPTPALPDDQTLRVRCRCSPAAVLPPVAASCRGCDCSACNAAAACHLWPDLRQAWAHPPCCPSAGLQTGEQR